MFSLGTNYRWSYIFEVMETNKANLKLNDYSVSQTSLEQVNILVSVYGITYLTLLF